VSKAIMKQICVFCGSSIGNRPEYAAAATAVGVGIARRGHELVYGGGNTGLMGTVANAALGAGGKVIGVIPSVMVDKELAHQGLTQLHVVNTMHERKAMMAVFADAFVILPGGFGTMDELYEILTWAQLGFHRKPIAILNVCGYYDPMLTFIDHLVDEGFVKQDHREVIVVGDDPDALLTRIESYQPPLVDKWLKQEDL
jgi:hypothetical protein